MEETLESITAIASKESCDLIVVAGDVWTAKSITHEERQLFSEWLGSSRHPMVVISGNHDKRSAQTEIGDTSLSYLSSLGSVIKRHLIWDQEPTIHDFHGCRFILCPAHGWTHAELSLMLQALISHAAGTNKKHLPIVVVLHEFVHGAKVEKTSWTSTKSTLIKLREGRYPEVTYWALGDVHLRQQILSNAFYPGTPHQTTFGESLPKGVLIVDLAKPTSPKFVPIKSLPLLQVSELPDRIPKRAYIEYEPTKIESKRDLPPNVVYHPNVSLLKTDRAIRKNISVGLLSRLDDWLVRSGQNTSRRRRSWILTKRMCESLDHPIKLPKKYRKSKRKEA